MVVPIVGAFLVDIIYQPQTIAFIKFFVPAASNLVLILSSATSQNIFDTDILRRNFLCPSL